MLHDGRSGRLQLIDTSARWSFLTASVREPPVRNCWAGACTLEASKRNNCRHDGSREHAGVNVSFFCFLSLLALVVSLLFFTRRLHAWDGAS